MQPSNGFIWFLAALKRYAEFKGRSCRREFWYFNLFLVAANIVASNLDSAIGVPLFSLVVTFGLLVPGIAVSVRRLHDTNRSGWWALLLIINIIFYAQDSDPSENRFGPNPKSADAPRGAAPAKSTISMDNLDQIEKLAALRDKGVLTEDEFQMKKTALL